MKGWFYFFCFFGVDYWCWLVFCFLLFVVIIFYFFFLLLVDLLKIRVWYVFGEKIVVIMCICLLCLVCGVVVILWCESIVGRVIILRLLILMFIVNCWWIFVCVLMIVVIWVLCNVNLMGKSSSFLMIKLIYIVIVLIRFVRLVMFYVRGELCCVRGVGMWWNRLWLFVKGKLLNLI